MTLSVLKSVLQQWLDTYDDHEAFPPEEYPELADELQCVKDFLNG